MIFLAGVAIALLVVHFFINGFFTVLGGKDEALYHPRFWWPIPVIIIIVWLTFF